MRVVRVLCIILGLVLLLVGGAVAVASGPDDVVGLPAKSVDTGGATVVESSPGFLAYRGTAVEVRAESPDGEVFVGAAHPVDVESYLGDVTRLRFDHVSAGGEVTGKLVKAARGAPSVAPGKAAFWTERASGTGVQRILVPLRGEPVALAVLPGEGGHGVRLGLGARLDGLFVTALVAVAVGLALLVLWFMLRRRREDAGDREPGRDQEAVAAAEPDGHDEPRMSASGVERRRRPWGRPVIAVAVVATLSGCVAVPQEVDPPRGPLTKPALTQAELPAMLADYDRRNNVANKAAAAPTYDAKPWATADTGAVLRADQFDTAFAKANAHKDQPAAYTHKPDAVHAPALPAYPMWALVTSDVTSTDPKDKPDPKKQGVALFERSAAAAPWLMSASWSTARADLPQGVEPAQATAAQRKAGVAQALQLIRWIRTGAKPSFALDENLTKHSATIAELRRTRGYDVVTESANFLTSADDQAGPGGSVHVARVKGGTLTAIELVSSQTITADSGFTLNYAAEYAKTFGYDHEVHSLVFPGVVTVLIHTPDGGKGKVIGSSLADTMR